MAYDITDWIPEEKDSDVSVKVNQTSAVEGLFKKVPMASATKALNRSNGSGSQVVAKSGVYTADTTEHGEVVLTARKFGNLWTIAEEDLSDALPDVINTHLTEWAGNVAKHLDNACLGVTAASNGTTIPFTSVYNALTTANLETGYTANDNLTQTGTGGVTYDNLSSTVGTRRA